MIKFYLQFINKIFFTNHFEITFYNTIFTFNKELMA